MKKIAEAFNGHGTVTRLFAVFLAAFICQVQQTAAADLGKIMPMGDSITLGVPVAGGYRDPLYTLLTNRADTFTFVGSQTGYATDALTAAGQTHHEGHSGFVITNGTGRTGLDENLASWIGSGKESPDKIILMIGSNDINLGYDMANAPARLSDLITHIYGYRPNVRLYVASIIPMVGHESDVQAFNAAIPGIVSSHRALGRDVVYVAMHDAVNIGTDLSDGLHPNALGYLHMAQAWDAALHATTNLTVAVASPANNQTFTLGTSISATVTVANAAGAYTAHVYTNSGAGAFAEAGAGGASSPYAINLGALPAGTYHLYATVADTNAAATSATNTFTVAAVVGNIHAVDVTSAGAGAGLGTRFSVGWDFTVTRPIKVTSLGQFDPDSNPKSNTVALYQRGGAKLVESVLSAAIPSELSGSFPARYVAVGGPLLTNGNYVVFSTQNGDNFIAPDGTPITVFGSAITWNKGVALGDGSAAGPVPATAPETWPIENAAATRYFGPTFKYDVVVPVPVPALTCPTNNQGFTVGVPITATATVAGASGAYTVHVYTNSGAGAFAEAGTGGSSSPYTVNFNALPAGTYHIYVSATDTNGTGTTATNTFTVSVKAGQQPLALTGWNQDIIIGAAEAAPGYSASMAGWAYYEKGLSGGTQGLAADTPGTNRTFASAYHPGVRFQFDPYAGSNAVYLSGPGSVTLTLVNPAKFQSLQFLETTRSMTWYARLNFADGSSTTTGTWSDPDWTANPGPADRCLSSYGLKSTTGSFYSGYLWMAERGFTLPVADQAKTLTSITITTTGTGDKQLALFAVSGYALDSLAGTQHAVELTSAGDGPGFGDTFSVGWDFTVTQPIKICALGQFDPNGTPVSNTVAIYRRGGAKLVDAAVTAGSPAELCGVYSSRFAAVGEVVLTNGNYVIVSTQNGDNFIAPGGIPGTAFGPGVIWNKGVAMASGSAAGPLPDAAPANWPGETTNAWRYFGPTFKYELVVPPPELTLVSPTNSQVLAAGDLLSASVTVARAVGAYTVHVYTNSGSDAFAEVGSGSSASPYFPAFGCLSAGGTYHVYATVTDTFSTTNTMTNTFTVAVKIGQQFVGLTGWNQDLIIGASEAAPGYSVAMGGWNFYERGLPSGAFGLPADAVGTNRVLVSSADSRVRFRFAPYVGKNALFLQGASNAPLTLINPSKFYSLQILAVARTATPPVRWYATLNFADGTSTMTDSWGDPDWIQTGPADTCLTSYGLKSTAGSFFSGYLWMASRNVSLPVADRGKTLNSIKVTTTETGDRHLAVFAVSGYAFGAKTNDFHAVDVTSGGSGPAGGGTYSIGWDFTVSETITVTSLGQFDPDANPKANAVAIYQRAGAKLVEAAVSIDSPAEPSGNYSARYAKIDRLVLAPGNYVVFSTQNGDNFLAGSGTVDSSFGPAIKWNKAVAMASGSSAGPLPESAPTTWPIENTSAYRYFGPTFKYELGAIWPDGLLIRIR